MTNKGPFPSRKGHKRKNCRRIIALLITVLISMFLLFTPNLVVSQRNISEVSAKAQERVKTDIIEKYVKELENQGYENVEYELSYLIKFSKENNIPIRPSISNGIDIKDSFIKMYDYYAIYYMVQVNEKDYLFKSESEAQNFTNTLNKYDGQKYEINTTKKMVNKETEENEINEIIEIKKQAYEKAKAEAEAKRKAEAEAKRKAEEQARKEKSTTNYSSSSSVSALQSYAHDLVINNYGWSEYDFECLVKLWNRESGWNPNAHNKSSGAHGIPQSLPASKMASEGSDYYTNGETQIRWGLKYIKNRYGSPSNAWAHSQQKGWY